MWNEAQLAFFAEYDAWRAKSGHMTEEQARVDFIRSREGDVLTEQKAKADFNAQTAGTVIDWAKT